MIYEMCNPILCVNQNHSIHFNELFRAEQIEVGKFWKMNRYVEALRMTVATASGALRVRHKSVFPVIF